jgi:tRNA-binding EMAP/Myf-like protein
MRKSVAEGFDKPHVICGLEFHRIQEAEGTDYMPVLYLNKEAYKEATDENKVIVLRVAWMQKMVFVAAEAMVLAASQAGVPREVALEALTIDLVKQIKESKMDIYVGNDEDLSKVRKINPPS